MAGALGRDLHLVAFNHQDAVLVAAPLLPAYARAGFCPAHQARRRGPGSSSPVAQVSFSYHR